MESDDWYSLSVTNLPKHNCSSFRCQGFNDTLMKVYSKDWKLRLPCEFCVEFAAFCSQFATSQLNQLVPMCTMAVWCFMCYLPRNVNALFAAKNVCEEEKVTAMNGTNGTTGGNITQNGKHRSQ